MVLGLIPEKVELETKKLAKKYPKGQNFSAVEILQNRCHVFQRTHTFRYLCFSEPVCRSQTKDVVLEMFRTQNRLNLGWWVGSQEVLFGTVPQTPLL